jgi:chemotaxis signal transduction protein
VSTNDPHIERAATPGSADVLRRLFDEGFAAAATAEFARLEGLLAIRLGSDPYALRLSEIAGLHAGVKIVPVPSANAQLLGIVGLRGVMAPIYDLAALLGYAPAANPRWMVLARMSHPVGFAFETFESHLRVPETSLANDESGANAGDGGQHARRHAGGAVRAAGALRPIIRMASVVELIGDKNS